MILQRAQLQAIPAFVLSFVWSKHRCLLLSKINMSMLRHSSFVLDSEGVSEKINANSKCLLRATFSCNFSQHWLSSCLTWIVTKTNLLPKQWHIQILFCLVHIGISFISVAWVNWTRFKMSILCNVRHSSFALDCDWLLVLLTLVAASWDISKMSWACWSDPGENCGWFDPMYAHPSSPSPLSLYSCSQKAAVFPKTVRWTPRRQISVPPTLNRWARWCHPFPSDPRRHPDRRRRWPTELHRVPFNRPFPNAIRSVWSKELHLGSGHAGRGRVPGPELHGGRKLRGGGQSHQNVHVGHGGHQDFEEAPRLRPCGTTRGERTVASFGFQSVCIVYY